MDKVIYAGKLVGMLDDFICDNMVLCLENGKISMIQRRDQFAPAKGIPVIDWGDYAVMPGLIDCHDHLGFDLGNEEAQAHEPDFVNVLRGVRNAKTLLKSGITSLRTMGEKSFMDIYWKKAIEADWILVRARRPFLCLT